MLDTPVLDDAAVAPARAPARFAFHGTSPRFVAPAARDHLVRRDTLLGRLQRERRRPLILLTAPAGYGKTTLLAQWAAETSRPCAWVALDRADDDPETLEASLTSALSIVGVAPGLRRSFGLVLDDAQLVEAEALSAAVRWILGWLPEHAQLAVASRCAPALPLGRMRAQRLVLEFDSTDLAMAPAEASSLLACAGLDPGQRPMQSLARRCEGWPVALELGTASWAHDRAPATRIDPLRGDDHVISEYIRTELLDSLSPATRRFLIRSSVLDRLSGPACDAVLDRTRSGRVLADLAGANLPLQPVDSSHETFRLHGLVREMLQTELRRLEPELAPLLHRRASVWYARAGETERAIEQARDADDLGRVGSLVWRHLPRLLGEGRNPLVQSWLHGIDPERAAQSVPLALSAAHSGLALGSVTAAEQWARSAAVRLADAAAEPSSARAGVLIIEAWAARSGTRQMREVAARAYDLLPGDDPWRASCCLLGGSSAMLTGDRPEAERLLEEGAGRGAEQATDVASLCLAQLAVCATDRDDPLAASDYASRARSLVTSHGLSATPASALVFAVWAAGALREGRIDETKAAVRACRDLLAELDDSLAWLSAETRILAARASLGLGHVACARELLADASRLARRTPDVVVFERWFDDAWAQFDRRAESTLAGVGSLTTAELRVLRFLPTHYAFHEIANRLHVSSNTVKTHAHAVYRKLDASSRSEAVATATRAGLLSG